MSSYECPKCGSENTQRASLLYAAGVSASSGGGVGVDLATGGVVVGGLSGRSRSGLAAAHAPPRRESAGTAVIVLVIMGVVSGLIAAANGGWEVGLALFLVFAGVAWLINRNVATQNKQMIEPAVAAWQKKFVCLRCGETFETSAQ